MGKEYYTIITGSSSGIGKQLALESARNKMNVLLIALPGTRLDKLCDLIRERYGVKAEYLHVDLTLPGSIPQVVEWIDNGKFAVNMLINNAGISCEGPFEKYSASFYRQLLMVNTHAVVMLTRACVRYLEENSPSWILNLGSVAAYFPMPYKAVYGSSKLFILSFSKVLREELKSKSIQVSVVCPGPVVTNRHTAQSALDKGRLARMMHTKAPWVARYTMKKLKKGSFLIKPGFLSTSTYYVSLLIPQFLRNILVEKVFYNE